MRSLVFLSLPVLSAVTIGCAGQRAEPKPGLPNRPMVASLEPVATPEIVETQHLNPAAAAGALLEQGMLHHRQGQFELASRAFHYAIETGRLNNAGRALAYWHIFTSSEELGRVDDGANALMSFVVVAEEVLEVRERLRYAVNSSGDFVDRFSLEPKLQRARAVLSATWASRTPSFGRTPKNPVPVHDDIELAQFLEIVAPCTKGQRDDRSQRQIEDDEGYPLQQVTLTCGGLGKGVDYYFDVMSAEE